MKKPSSRISITTQSLLTNTTMNTTTQPSEAKIKETMASSGKTTINDLVAYGKSKYPSVDASLIKSIAKELKDSVRF